MSIPLSFATIVFAILLNCYKGTTKNAHLQKFCAKVHFKRKINANGLHNATVATRELALDDWAAWGKGGDTRQVCRGGV